MASLTAGLELPLRDAWGIADSSDTRATVWNASGRISTGSAFDQAPPRYAAIRRSPAPRGRGGEVSTDETSGLSIQAG